MASSGFPEHDPAYMDTIDETDLVDQVIETCRIDLEDGLCTEIINDLFKEHLLDDREWKEIRDQDTTPARNRMLLTALRRSRSRGYFALVRLMKKRKQEQLVKRLETTFEKKEREHMNLQKFGLLKTGDPTEGVECDLWKEVFRTRRELIEKELSENFSTIAKMMRRKDLISPLDCQDLVTKSTRDCTTAIARLSSLLKTTGDGGFKKFLGVLRDLERTILAEELSNDARRALQDAGAKSSFIMNLLSRSHEELKPGRQWWQTVFLPETPKLRRYLDPQNLLVQLEAEAIINTQEKRDMRKVCERYSSDVATDHLIDILERKSQAEYEKLPRILYEVGGEVAEIAKKLMRKQIHGERRIKPKRAWKLYQTTTQNQSDQRHGAWMMQKGQNIFLWDTPRIQCAADDIRLQMRLSLEDNEPSSQLTGDESQNGKLPGKDVEQTLRPNDPLRTMVLVGNSEIIDELLYSKGIADPEELSNVSNQATNSSGSSVCFFVDSSSNHCSDVYIVVRLHEREDADVQKALLKLAMEASPTVLFLHNDVQRATDETILSPPKMEFSDFLENTRCEQRTQPNSTEQRTQPDEVFGPLNILLGAFEYFNCVYSLSHPTPSLTVALVQPDSITYGSGGSSVMREKKVTHIKQLLTEISHKPFGGCNNVPLVTEPIACSTQDLNPALLLCEQTARFKEWFMNVTKALPMTIVLAIDKTGANVLKDEDQHVQEQVGRQLEIKPQITSSAGSPQICATNDFDCHSAIGESHYSAASAATSTLYGPSEECHQAEVRLPDPKAVKCQCFPTQITAEKLTTVKVTDDSVKMFYDLDRMNPWKDDWVGINGQAYVTTVLADDELFAMDVIDFCCGGLMKLFHHPNSTDSTNGDHGLSSTAAAAASTNVTEGNKPMCLESQRQARLIMFSKAVGARIQNFLSFQGLDLLGCKHFADADIAMLVPALALSNLFVICSRKPEAALQRLLPALRFLKQRLVQQCEPSEYGQRIELDKEVVDSQLFSARVLIIRTCDDGQPSTGLELPEQEKRLLKCFFKGPFEMPHRQVVGKDLEGRRKAARVISLSIKDALSQQRTSSFNSTELSNYLSATLSAIATNNFEALSLTKVFEKEAIDFLLKVVCALQNGYWGEDICSSAELDDWDISTSTQGPYNWAEDANLPLGLPEDLKKVRSKDNAISSLRKATWCYGKTQCELISTLRKDIHQKAQLNREVSRKQDWKQMQPQDLEKDMGEKIRKLTMRRHRGVKAMANRHINDLRVRKNLKEIVDSYLVTFQEFWQPCFRKCKECHFCCLKPSGHKETLKDECDCMDIDDTERKHICSKECIICKEVREDGEKQLCLLPAGHKDDFCRCWPENGKLPYGHGCEEDCMYSEALVHATGKADGKCCDFLHHDKLSGKPTHRCELPAEKHTCPKMCYFSGTEVKCPNHCSKFGMEIKEAHGHFCLAEHCCPEYCQAPGRCVPPATTVERNICARTSDTEKARCTHMIEAGYENHFAKEAEHVCTLGKEEHYCDKQCILCNKWCELLYDHGGLCDIRHGLIENVSSAMVYNCIRKEVVQGQASMQCNTLCNEGDRGHEHLIRLTSEVRDQVPHQKLLSRYKDDSSFDNADEYIAVPHAYFYEELLHVKDPHSKKDAEKFNMCPTKCPEEHDLTSFCQLENGHDPMQPGEGDGFHIGHRRDDERKQDHQQNWNIEGCYFKCEHDCPCLCTLKDNGADCRDRNDQQSICQFKMGHVSEGCSCRKTHVCGKACPAVNCGKPCSQEVQHADDPSSQCWCGNAKCPVQCQVKGCDNPCYLQDGKQDHLHGRNGGDLHHCNQQHDCRELCSVPAVCFLTKENESPPTDIKKFEGGGSNGYTWYCKKPINPGSIEHSGEHQCDKSSVEHTCTTSCPLCQCYCVMHNDHRRDHFIENHGRVVNLGDVHIEKANGRRLDLTGEDIHCHQLCDKAGRGHLHVVQQQKGHSKCTSSESEGRFYCDGAVHKYSHAQYWKTQGVADPYKQNSPTLSDFNGCPTMCNSRDHEDKSTPVYCKLELFHPRATSLPTTMAGHGYVGQANFGKDRNERSLEGCVFECSKHQCEEPCNYRKRDDQSQCFNRCKFNRSEHGNQRCRCAANHVCGRPCQALGCRSVVCIKDPDEKHSTHSCGAAKCLQKCEFESCNRNCDLDHHHHTGEKHDCGERHQCNRDCSEPGLCEKPEDSVSALDVKSKCIKMCDPGQANHPNKSKHHCGQKHKCERQCPACNTYCEKDYHKVGTHRIQHHGKVEDPTKIQVFKGGGELVEVNRSFVSCDQVCDTGGRGHKHRNPSPRVLSYGKPKPVNHAEFWHAMEFEDPSSESQSKQYMSCHHECPLRHIPGEVGPFHCEQAVDHNGYHICDREHVCDEDCTASGICGDRDEGKDKCVVRIKPGALNHQDPHRCGNDKHKCDRKCPWCNMGCKFPYGHTQPCDPTNHGVIDGKLLKDITIFQSSGTEYSFGKKTKVTLTCSNMCNLAGNSHVHRVKCSCSTPLFSILGTNQPKEYRRHDQRDLDSVPHFIFWQDSGFKDPYPETTSSEFNSCDAECPRHAGRAPEQPRVCVERLYHGQLNSENHTDHSGVVIDGHKYPCQEHRCGKPCPAEVPTGTCGQSCMKLSGHDEVEDKSLQTQCSCGYRHPCPTKCEYGCDQFCQCDHETTAGGSDALRHHCNKAHKCKEPCAADGPCLLEDPDELAQSPQMEIIADRNAFRLKCDHEVQKGKTSHGDIHRCNKAKHSCSATCPFCTYYCVRSSSGHTGPHQFQAHGQAKLSSTMYLYDGSGQKHTSVPEGTTCTDVCGQLKTSQHHYHGIPMDDYNQFLTQNSDAEPIMVQRKRDSGKMYHVNHSTFCRVYDYPRLEGSTFDQCPATCPRCQDENVMVPCTKPLLHSTTGPHNKERTGVSIHTGSGGGWHHFPCVHHTCKEHCSHKTEHHTCKKTCAQKLQHDGECSCNQPHPCGAKCFVNSYCHGTCSLPHDHDHDEQHHCGGSKCPRPCSHCAGKCATDDHFHGAQGTALHDCASGKHVCSESRLPTNQESLCEGGSGNCEVSDSDDIRRRAVNGEEIDPKRLPCQQLIPTGQTSHHGAHSHSPLTSNPEHFCTARCPMCGESCTRTVHSIASAHSVNHKSVIHVSQLSKHVSKRPLWYVRDKAGDPAKHTDGTYPTCEQLCRDMGSGHLHTKECAETAAECFQEVGKVHHPVQHSSAKAYDGFSHEQFWKRIGFEDPCSSEEIKDFHRCATLCGHSDHASAGPRCLGIQLHQDMQKKENADAKREFGGHLFDCQHKCPNPCHFVSKSRNCENEGKCKYHDDHDQSVQPCICTQSNHLCKELCQVAEYTSSLCNSHCSQYIITSADAAHTTHLCTERGCSGVCTAAGCEQHCSRSHGHVLSSVQEDHLCHETAHPCNGQCQLRGICKLVEQATPGSIATNELKRMCCARPKGHTGEHRCSVSAEEHMCMTKCPLCQSNCTLKLHNDSTLHRTVHGHHPAGEYTFNAAILKPVHLNGTSELFVGTTQSVTCGEICMKVGRGHMHHNVLPRGDKLENCSCRRRSEVQRHEDSHWHSHAEFWTTLLKFEDPLAGEYDQLDSFAKCAVRCHEGHTSYCDLDLQHASEASLDKHVRAGHKFPQCPTPCAQKCSAGFHEKTSQSAECCRIRDHDDALHFCQRCHGMLCKSTCPWCNSQCRNKIGHGGKHVVTHSIIQKSSAVVHNKLFKLVDHRGLACPGACDKAGEGHYHVLQTCSTANGESCFEGKEGYHFVKHHNGTDCCTHDSFWNELSKIAMPAIRR
ncbi:uncharacterized protein LOC135806388 [Sycon ciliatum]|uniref:uncharacterized protein LOC135806388 n=1 Tax=Sycon ciliatum TaxID=27933 RepID=UPI0031F6CF19